MGLSTEQQQLVITDNHELSTFLLTMYIHLVFSCSKCDDIRTNVFGTILNDI